MFIVDVVFGDLGVQWQFELQFLFGFDVFVVEGCDGFVDYVQVQVEVDVCDVFCLFCVEYVVCFVQFEVFQCDLYV